MAKPISPDEVVTEKQGTLPDAVLEAFNELIVEKFNNGSAEILHKEVHARILSKMKDTPDFKPEHIYEKGWLNVEGIYRNAGWNVTYDKPGYNESYDASFRFAKRPKF